MGAVGYPGAAQAGGGDRTNRLGLSLLQEGRGEPGLPVELADRPYPEVTAALVNDFGHGRNRDIEAARARARCSLLPEW